MQPHTFASLFSLLSLSRSLQCIANCSVRLYDGGLSLQRFPTIDVGNNAADSGHGAHLLFRGLVDLIEGNARAATHGVRQNL